MTSAVDLLPTKPVARPEPAAPKATSPKDDGPSFADLLETETATSRAPDSEDDVATETATATAPVIVQPDPPPATPVITAANSPEAILAGLSQVQPAPDATVDGAAEAPSIDSSAPPVPQPGASAAAAAAAQAAAAVPAQAPAAPAAKAATTPTAKPTSSAAPSDSADENNDKTDSAPVPAANAAPAPQAGVITAAAVTPTTAPQPEAASLSAPGAERAAAAPIEATPTSAEKLPAAAQTGAASTRATATKPASAATLAAEAAPEIKPDIAPPPATSTPADPLAAARTTTTDAMRATQTNPALQNAPPTTVQVYQRMVERFDGRAQRYEIRLDPAELGRVDVRIEVGADKKIHAVLAAHDSAALTDLIRGQRSLERALSDAGIDVAEGGIKFELSTNQNRDSAGDQNTSERNASANVWRGFAPLDVAVDHQTAAAARPWRPSSRLDLVA